MTCTATDDSGNRSTCSFVVTAVAPALVLQVPSVTGGALDQANRFYRVRR